MFGGSGPKFEELPADLLDASLTRWSRPKTSFTTAGMNATALNDGRVLFAGGYFGCRQAAAVFDPVSGTWSAAANLPDAEFHDAIVMANDGRAYAFGGMCWKPTADVDRSPVRIFDPVTMTWSWIQSNDSRSSTRNRAGRSDRDC